MQHKDEHAVPTGRGMVRRGGSRGGLAGASAHVSRQNAVSAGGRLALALGLALVLSLLTVVLTATVSGPAGAQALPGSGGELEPPAEDTGSDLGVPFTDDAGDSGSNSNSCRLQDDKAESLVPGAPEQDGDCLQDLTTAGTQETGHTNRQDWEGLNADGTRNPSGVSGLQVDGYFPDDSDSNQNNGYSHDSQFVIRFPNEWNGKLVITGAPGVRRQYANDFIMSDFFLAKGYAFAATDKGNTGIGFYEDGQEPGDAIAEGHRRVEELTRAAKKAAVEYYGKELDRTYITGISNGGYLTRYALENNPQLYDGGVDWEGTLYRPQGPNLFTWLPVALRNYPDYEASGDDRQGQAYENMIEGGYARGSEFLWDDHYAVYWDLTQRIYREEFDPRYDGLRGENGTPPGVPFCQDETNTPGCDANYRYDKRPQGVKDAVRKVSLTGDIGKPMITLHGDLDTLLPIRTDSDPYRTLIKKAGNDDMHRYLVVGRGNHVDGLYDEDPGRLRPILPCYRDAFVALDRSVDGDGKLPENGFIPKPKNGDVVNDCNFGDRGQRPDRGPQPGSGGSEPEPEPEPKPEECTTTGTRRDDTLQGTDRRDVICGKGGDDTIRGLGGDDTLRGGLGSDTTQGGDGDDTIEGGRGADTLGGEYGNDRFDARDGVGGNDTVNGGSGGDTCRADRGDTVTSCS